MKPRILDRSFKYVPASKTDIRVTFRRIRRELDQQKQAAPVVDIKRCTK